MQGPVIRVLGVGNGGCNAVTQILRQDVAGVDLIAVDTDVRKLKDCDVPNKLVIGSDVTGGLGTGGDPQLGAKAAETSAKEIAEHLKGANMVFVTAAMGGGTGTGAAPVICRLAKEQGALTVAICTKPFAFERKHRLQTAQSGIDEIGETVDAYVVIDNQRLLENADKQTSLMAAFAMADDLLRQAVQGVSDLITIPGTINVDFADVQSVLADAGPVLMGLAEAPQDSQPDEIVQRTVASPLLENGILGATNILLNVMISPEVSLWQVHEIADAVARATATEEPNVIFGTVVDPALKGKIKLTLLAASFTTPIQSYRADSRSIGRQQPARPSNPQPRPQTQIHSREIDSPQPLPPIPPSPTASPGSDQGDLDMPTFIRRQFEREKRERGEE